MSTDTPQRAQRAQRIEHVVGKEALEAVGLDTACPVCGAQFDDGHHACEHSDLRRVCGECCPKCLT